MKGEHGKENLLSVAETDRINSKVAGMAIKNEQAIP
jgi:hypothetical protein